jgi:nucleoid-associated protein YgaU
VEAEAAVPVGRVTIRADALDALQPESAAAAAEAEAPFVRYSDGLVLEPVVTAVNAGEAAEAAARPQPPSFVIIRRGDNLWRISRRNYGRGIRYEAIFAANRDQIRNPHRIYPGQVFIIPARDRSWETATN